MHNTGSISQRGAIELAEFKYAILLRADRALGRSMGHQTGEGGVALGSRFGFRGAMFRRQPPRPRSNSGSGCCGLTRQRLRSESADLIGNNIFVEGTANSALEDPILASM